MLAFAGLQLLTVIVRVSETVPVFRMYIVCVLVPPGLNVPALSEVTGIVQALSEYAAKFTVAIVPAYGTVLFALRTARVVAVRTAETTIKAIISIPTDLFNAIVLTSAFRDINRKS